MGKEMNETKSMETVIFKIEGLSCSCEAQIIEKRLKSLKGVSSYSLNPISYQMKITYDPVAVSIEDIQKTVAKAGAKALLLKK